MVLGASAGVLLGTVGQIGHGRLSRSGSSTTFTGSSDDQAANVYQDAPEAVAVKFLRDVLTESRGVRLESTDVEGASQAKHPPIVVTVDKILARVTEMLQRDAETSNVHEGKVDALV